MKTLALTIAFIISVFTASAQETKGQTLTVTIDNVMNQNGNVIFALHTQDTFMKTSGVQTEVSEIEDGKAKVTFKNVASGTYAILTLHDENQNKRMDFLPNGMPKESYGLSNNPILYGPPTFEAAKFEVTDEDKEIAIRF